MGSSTATRARWRVPGQGLGPSLGGHRSGDDDDACVGEQVTLTTDLCRFRSGSCPLATTHSVPRTPDTPGCPAQGGKPLARNAAMRCCEVGRSDVSLRPFRGRPTNGLNWHVSESAQQTKLSRVHQLQLVTS